MASRAAVKKRLKQEDIEFLLVQFVDITGSAKVKMVPVSSLDDAADEGAGFAGAAVWGSGQGPHSHDMLARIDLDSYSRLAWQPNTVRFAGDLFVDDVSYPYCPRTNLKRVLAEAKAQGYVFNVGMEPEHFLVSRDENGAIRPWDPDGDAFVILGSSSSWDLENRFSRPNKICVDGANVSGRRTYHYLF